MTSTASPRTVRTGSYDRFDGDRHDGDRYDGDRHDDSVLLRVSEAALLASCGVDDVLAAVIRGELPAVTAGSSMLVPRGALVATLRARRGARAAFGRAS